MPNEYGKILLQQIEQQRRQRLRQRAEERGLPVPPDEHSGSLSAGDTTRVADCRALAPTSAGGVSPHDFQVNPGNSCTSHLARTQSVLHKRVYSTAYVIKCILYRASSFKKRRPGSIRFPQVRIGTTPAR